MASTLVGACGQEASDPKTGSNSNWLVACRDQGDCGSAERCVCGACSQACDSDADCTSLQGAHCSLDSETATSTQCGAGAPGSGLCLPTCTAGSCGAGKSCVDGACVLAELPDSEFCAPVTEPGTPAQMREDELLTLLQQDRIQGLIACAGASEAPAPPLHLDGRLSCAARVKARDQAQSGLIGPVDSLERDVPERLMLSGYPFSTWWESYAYDASTANEAYELILADVDSCVELASSTYVAVGIGSVDDVFVVTLASE